MRLATEATLGNIIFNTIADAEAFVADMINDADVGETYEVQAYQGGRYHVARFYNGQFEAFC